MPASRIFFQWPARRSLLRVSVVAGLYSLALSAPPAAGAAGELLLAQGMELDTIVQVAANASGDAGVDVAAPLGAAADATGAELSWVTLLPPVLAIVIALTTRAVVPALLVGIWVGVFLLQGGGVPGMWSSFLRSFDTYVVEAIADKDRVRVILFTMMLGGMVGILARNGGMNGVVAWVTRYASSARRGRLATATLGLVVFFDDIANTLLIGKTMQPVTDRLRISRQKLAYLVDSTAAPIAGVAFASTWVGYEVSVIGATAAEIPALDSPPYLIFLGAVPYSFYSIITLFMVFAVAWSGRDFGPMHTAERRAWESGSRKPAAAEADARARAGAALNAVLPIVAVVVTLMLSLWITGQGETFEEVIGSADSYAALMWASLLGVVSAVAVSVLQGALSLDESIEAWSEGLRSTVFAVVVLALSWTLADVVSELNTATYLIGFAERGLPLYLLPAISFLLSGIVAFTTGTSWGTMGILIPLILPLSWTMLSAGSTGAEPISELAIFNGSIAGVLAGAIWGDHCSPISDTTVLSSLAADSDHIEHVRTQLPYAMTCGACALFLCALPVGLGIPWWLCLLVSFAVVAALLRWVGRPSEGPQASPGAP